MNKTEIFKRIRDPEKWNDDFFQSIVDLSRKGALNIDALTGIVRRELPNGLQTFNDGWAAAEGQSYFDRLKEKKRSNPLISIPTADTITAKDPDWIYKPYIPRGKVTLIAANPGTGKTFVMCYISACVSTGRPIFAGHLISGCEYSGAEPGRVLYITAEDGAADTIVPRLQWCGADLKKIRVKECETEGLTFAGDEFREMITLLRPDLVIADPFQSFFTEKVDINAPNKTRAQLFPVIRLADETNTAIVLVCHLNKNKQGDIITRVLGSMDIVGCCRSMLAVGNVPGKVEGLKFISHEKSSLARSGETYLFHLDPAAGGVVIEGTTSLTFDDYSAMERSKRKRSGDATDSAKQFLMEQMKDGCKPFKELKELAKADGISEWALKTAAEDMEIVKKRAGFPAVSMWYLPGHDPDSADLQTAGTVNGRS